MVWNVNIQYKNTNICLDFYCPACGAEGHYDGYFGQVLTCPGCGKLWQLPNEIRAVETSPEFAISTPVALTREE